MIIRNDDVKRPCIQCLLEGRAIADTFDLGIQTVLGKHRADQLGEIRLVFEM